MNALELANEIEKGGKDGFYQDEMVAILRQQAKEIEQLTITNQDLKYQLIKKSGEQVLDDFSKDMLQKQAKEIEQFRFVLRNLSLATSKKIGELEEELENCTCKGGHSEAYLKVKER
jgi:hypothetical protein